MWKTITLKESYPFECYKCKKEQRACPSMFMSTGMLNRWGGRCIECWEYNILEIDLDTNERMIATKQELKKVILN